MDQHTLKKSQGAYTTITKMTCAWQVPESICLSKLLL